MINRFHLNGLTRAFHSQAKSLGTITWLQICAFSELYYKNLELIEMLFRGLNKSTYTELGIRKRTVVGMFSLEIMVILLL